MVKYVIEMRKYFFGGNMNRRLCKFLLAFLLFVITVFFSNNAYAKETPISNCSDIDIVSMYNTANSGFVQNGKKWRVFMIEHRMVAKSVKNTALFYYNEVISHDTPFTSATTTTISTKSGFTNEVSISTTESVTIAGESTIAAGAKVKGVELSGSKKLQKSYTKSSTTEYSSSYTTENSIEWTYDSSSLSIPRGCSYCIGTVGDYILFKAKIYEEKNWWGKWSTCSEVKEVWVKIIVFSYQTVIYSNGEFESKPARDYIDY